MSEGMNAAIATEGAENAVAVTIEAGAATIIAEEKPATANAGGGTGVYVHKFKKPFEYEGKKYETLNFYFDRLTGRDMVAVENEMFANNEFALDPLISKSFQSKIASRASGMGSDVIEAMPIMEFSKITNAARNFLVDSGY